MATGALAARSPTSRPGDTDRSGITASYWNTQARGQTATNTVHLDPAQYNAWPRDTRRTTAELRRPTGYTGIYASLGRSQGLPRRLLRLGLRRAPWTSRSCATPAPAWRPSGSRCRTRRSQRSRNRRLPTGPRPQGIDYDQDDDGLIEVWNLAQLNAVRYDWSGLGWPYSKRHYYWAFPNPMTEPHMGCPEDGCIGYELMTNLDFDTNGNGRTDPEDHYWNGVHLPDDHEECIDWYRWHPRQEVRETPGACDDYWGNDGEGWRSMGSITTRGSWHGVFEGNGHTIRNLYINTLDTPFTEEVLNRVDAIYGLPTRAGDGYHNYKGIFFENIAYEGVIRNLRLENVNVSGKAFVGALTASNHGIISNVHVTGAVSGISNVGGLVGIAGPDSYIMGSSARAGVAGRKVGGQDVGGLAGLNQGVIQASYARGAVSGWADNTGGLVGRNAGGHIKASYATGPASTAGQRSGGLVGDNAGGVTASYATGGALVGRQGDGAVTAAYWDTQASGVGTSPAGAGKTTAELRQPTGYAGIYAGWNLDLDADDSGDDPWHFGTTSQYPVLKHGGLRPQRQRESFTARPLNLPRVGGGEPPPANPNRAPRASGSLDDVTVTGGGGTRELSLTGLFSDADGDALTVTARALTITAEPPPGHDGSSYIEVVTLSVAADYSSLTLTGQVPGVATVTVTASDGKGGAAIAEFVATTVAAGVPEPDQPAPEEQQGAPPAGRVAAEFRITPRSAFGNLIGWMQASNDCDCQGTLESGTDSLAFSDRDGAGRRANGVLRMHDDDLRLSVSPDNTPSDRMPDRVELRTGSAALVFSGPHNYAQRRLGAQTDYALESGSLSEFFVAGEAVTVKLIYAAPQQQQQGTPNRAPAVASTIADTTIVNASGTQQVSLSGVFSDADNDALTITAGSSDDAVATVSVASDQSSLTVTAKTRGTATVMVTASDGNGGAVQDAFTVTVKAAPAVASALADVSGLEVDATRDVSLSGVFSDADGDSLTITAVSSDDARATVIVASDGSKLTLAGSVRGRGDDHGHGSGQRRQHGQRQFRRAGGQEVCRVRCRGLRMAQRAPSGRTTKATPTAGTGYCSPWGSRWRTSR